MISLALATCFFEMSHDRSFSLDFRFVLAPDWHVVVECAHASAHSLKLRDFQHAASIYKSGRTLDTGNVMIGCRFGKDPWKNDEDRWFSAFLEER